MKRTRWYKDGVFYQIWPRSFKDGNGDGMGDLYGVYEKLDYLKSLGVDGIWFSPLYPSPGADCGYDISDYYDIAQEFGGMEAFRKVLDGAHKTGDGSLSLMHSLSNKTKNRPLSYVLHAIMVSCGSQAVERNSSPIAKPFWEGIV